MTITYTNYDGIKLSIAGGPGPTYKASTGNDYLVGNNAGDWFTSDNNIDTFVGGSGNDTYSVSNSATQIIEAANGGSDTVQATSNYALPANVENLLMYGSAIHGVTGVGNNLANIIISKLASQTLNGLGGDDVLVGSSAGLDTFIFQANSGNDIVQSFIAGSGANADTVRIQDYGFYTFSQVQAAMTQSGSNVVLKLDANDSVNFANTTVSAFTASNFQLGLDPSRLAATFDDEFNSLNLDSGGGAIADGIWSTQFGYGGYGTLASIYIGNYTNEQEIYLDPSFKGTGTTPLGLNPFSISNGVLTITAGLIPAQDESVLYNNRQHPFVFYSGLLTSKTSLNQEYGYFDIRAEMPSGPGAWPGFWLLPSAGGRPPEIDVFESDGSNPDYIKLSVHDASLPNGTFGAGVYIPDATTAFHDYGLLWTAQTLTWYIDGAQAAQVATPADLNQPMYMLINLALGGDTVAAPDPNNPPTGFKVDYVHVYQVVNNTLVVPVGPASLMGTAGNDTIIDSGGGGDTINGGAGTDVLVYYGTRSQYTVYSDGAGGYYVETNALGTTPSLLDHIVNIETIQFSDQSATPASLATGSVLTVAAGSASLTGTAGNDIIINNSSGGDTVDGGGGSDTLDYSGARSLYTVYGDGAGGYYVETNALGTAPSLLDHIVNIQTLQFSDQSASPASLSIGTLLTLPKGPASLTGTAGNDIIIDNGGGGDSINGGGGSDTLVYAGSSSQYTVYADGAGGYYVETNSFGTTTALFDHIVNIQTLQFSDQSASPSALSIGTLLTVPRGPASLTGTAGNDIIIDSGGGGDSINGGGGHDALIYVGTQSQYTVYSDGAGGYYVETNALGTSANVLDHIVNIQTLEFSDQSASPASLTVGSVLIVPPGAASLTGTTGNDIIIDSGGGGDTLNGGGGSDTVDYAGTRSQYTVFADGSGGYYVETNALGTTPSLLDHLTNIQTLQFSDQSAAISSLVGGSVLQAGAGAVTLNGTSGADILVSGSGVDTLNGNGGADVFYVSNASDIVNEAAGSGAIVYVSAFHWYANATAGVAEVIATGTTAINLTGNGYAMTLVANNGIDTLSDNGVADTLIGGTGIDGFVVANAATVVQAASGGSNTIKTSLASYTLPANVQNLTYTGTGAFYGVGGSLAGTLTGGVGNDTLVSGTGVETLNGGGGTDAFYVNNPLDVVVGASGSHSVEFTSVSGVKAGSNIVALTYTGTGNFTGYANATGTFLTGGHGNDFLDGGAGADTLDGGGGNDTLIAGTGSDQFRFDAPGLGVDQISGFVSGKDHIDLSGSGFGLSSLAGVGFDIGAAPTVIANGHAQIVYNSTTGALYFDAVGGDGHLIQLANLVGHPTVAASDFLLV
jgi:Ca2+-binding RTX toxin-like protein